MDHGATNTVDTNTEPTVEPPSVKFDVQADEYNMYARDNKGKDGTDMYLNPAGEPLTPQLLNELTHFRKKQDKGYVDVWWLYDDGGELLNKPIFFRLFPTSLL